MQHFIWDFSPEIFKIGSFGPRYYGLMFALGFLVGYNITQRIFLKEGRNEEDLSSLLFHIMVGTIVGARVGHCLFYEPDYYLSHPLEILFVWRGGLASHGGTIGVLIALWLYKRKHPDQGYVWLADRLAIGTAFTAGCIRIGNFFNSEILGKPSDVPWAIIFASNGDMIPRHPAMLYESLAYMILFGVMLWMYWKTNAANVPGRLIGIMLAWIYTARFFIEFVKENQVAFENGMDYNMGQLLSIPFVIIGLLLFSGKLVEWFPWLNYSTPLPASPASQAATKKKI
ncbi:MAG: prolipoprotein diacylglyceryl transferase [Proteobacteria bacterium]|nr:MAG: prolipoprotein diacylglyceryl transferase [Pseudomonadota bacterium]